MKLPLSSKVVGSIFFLSALFVRGQDNPRASFQGEVLVPAEEIVWGGSELLDSPAKVFLLNGFDSDDLIEIPIAGYLKGPEQSMKSVRANVDPQTKEIRIELGLVNFELGKGLDLPLSACGRLPFSEVVTLRNSLPGGSYTVFLGKQKVGVLEIYKSTSAPELGRFFALVDAIIVKEENILLQARLPSDFEVEENISTHIQDDGHILILLPEVHRDETRKFPKVVKMALIPVAIPSEFKKQLENGKEPMLIHVRIHQFSTVQNRWVPRSINRIIFPKE